MLLKGRATFLWQGLPITGELLTYPVVRVAAGAIDPAFADTARVVEAE